MGFRPHSLSLISYLLFTLSFANLLAFLSIQLVAGGRGDHYFIDPSRVTQISWRPRVFLYKGFLSHEECSHLISLTHGKLRRSRIVANATGVTIPSNKRTSSGMFLRPGQDEIVQRIEQRIAAWTYLPEENGERIQILRYNKGEKFDVHNDYFSLAVNLRQGNRIATVLMYLSDVEKGGETFFPRAGPLRKKDNSWSFCASTVLAVKPKKGDALLFFNLKPNGGIDEFSKHGSCPVVEGVKWTATRWIHAMPYNNTNTNTNNAWFEQSKWPQQITIQ